MMGFLAILILATIALLVLRAFRQAKSANIERKKQIDAALRDLQVIIQAEQRHIENQRKFADIEELISGGELGAEMTGLNGYIYSVRLDGNHICTIALPAPGENLLPLVSHTLRPAIDRLLGMLKKED